MKKTLLFTGLMLFVCIGALLAQGSDFGKTYYDAAKTKPKEVYSYKETASFDPNNPGAGTQKVKKKHGPYFFYHENGKLKVSGQYRDDQKQGEWKYYDNQGTLLNSESYNNGQVTDTK